MATHGGLVSTHMPKKSWVKNWLHECQLLASVMLPLSSTVTLTLVYYVFIIISMHLFSL